MKRLTVGILAHVDSGKTTLSEGLLYKSGEISKPGRVDHKNAFLDTNNIERERGITIFSHQAQIRTQNCEFTLLDTPGHVDFCAEAERTLQILDYAILVVSASDIVQSHTRTLWKMIYNHKIPTFIFVNKMDLQNNGKENIINELKNQLSQSVVDFTKEGDDFYEALAMCAEGLLDEYLKNSAISKDSISDAISVGEVIPCYFGSALKIEGVLEFLNGLTYYTKEKKYGNEFGAKVYKISEDEKRRRLTHIKVTGGSLKIRDVIPCEKETQKVSEIRIYQGENFTNVNEVFAGGVCAVCGLGKTFVGEGLGIEPHSEELVSEPVFSYSVVLPDGFDDYVALGIFKKLEEEETRLCVDWEKTSKKINIRVMGQIQLEVIKRILKERFSLDVEFENPKVVYKETISDKVVGVGHYEPLRHYAEVHLLMEPLKRGSGLLFDVDLSDDVLGKNYKSLILSHLAEKEHIGVLTGSKITDIKITVVNGKAHQKHTEGGDFRQATYRAVRQGLMRAKNILLEPWYNFTIEIPTENIGRAMTDLEIMGAKYNPPEQMGEISTIKGSGAVTKLCDYHLNIISYTKGRGRISFEFKGYEECKEQEEIVKQIGYDCESDTENTADSVFCSHGSGYVVKWDKVYENMHLEVMNPNCEDTPVTNTVVTGYRKIAADDNELLRIFEMTYGKVKQKSYQAMKTQKTNDNQKTYKSKPIVRKPKYLLIDGYNIIYSWDWLAQIAKESLDDAREILISKISNYCVMREEKVIVVFDAYKVKGGVENSEIINSVTVVYTREAETADSYIEKTSHELSKNYSVSVATSDNLEQMIIFGSGAIRVTPKELFDEVCEAEKEIREFIKNNNVPTDNL